MKPRTLLSLAALAAASWLAPAAHAEFNPALVPADAKWVVYADFASLRETALGQQLIARLPVSENLPIESPIQPNIGKIIASVGSITGFGNLEFTPEMADMTGTLVVQGTTDLRKIAEGLVAHLTVSDPEQFVEITDLPIEAYRLHGEIVVGFPEEPIILVSRSSDTLLQALELYRGKGPSLARGRHALTGLLPDKGSYYIFAASQVPGEALGGGENSPQARVLQMTQAASVMLGESGNDLIAAATLESKDNALADKLVKILTGLTAMLSLAESTDADLTAFLNSVQIRRDEARVSVNMAYPTDRLVVMLEQQIQNMEDHAAGPVESADHAGHDAPRSASEVTDVEGEVIGRWTADAELGHDAPSENGFALFTAEPVDLAVGSRLILTSARHDGEHARIDYLELIPTTGGEPLRFEAEFMRLGNYDIEGFDHASGGELIRTNGGRATAQVRFHGPAGSYRARVRYVDENDGAAAFALSHVAPAPAAN